MSVHGPNEISEDVPTRVTGIPVLEGTEGEETSSCGSWMPSDDPSTPYILPMMPTALVALTYTLWLPLQLSLQGGWEVPVCVQPSS